MAILLPHCVPHIRRDEKIGADALGGGPSVRRSTARHAAVGSVRGQPHTRGHPAAESTVRLRLPFPIRAYFDLALLCLSVVAAGAAARCAHAPAMMEFARESEVRVREDQNCKGFARERERKVST